MVSAVGAAAAVLAADVGPDRGYGFVDQKLVEAAVGSEMVPAEAGREALELLRDIRWDIVRLIRWTRR